MTHDPCPNCKGTGLVPHTHQWVTEFNVRRCKGCRVEVDLSPLAKRAIERDGVTDCTPLLDQVEAALARVRREQ